LGYTLTEELLLDELGRPRNANFLDYKMFTAKDMPKLTTILAETDEPLGPYGAKSISEVPINGPHRPSPMRFFTRGNSIRKLPIRPEDVLSALCGQVLTCGRLSIGLSLSHRCWEAVDGYPLGSAAGCQPAPHKHRGQDMTPTIDTTARRLAESYEADIVQFLRDLIAIPPRAAMKVR